MQEIAGPESLDVAEKVTRVIDSIKIAPVSYTHLTLPTTPYV